MHLTYLLVGKVPLLEKNLLNSISHQVNFLSNSALLKEFALTENGPLGILPQEIRLEIILKRFELMDSTVKHIEEYFELSDLTSVANNSHQITVSHLTHKELQAIKFVMRHKYKNINCLTLKTTRNRF